MFIKGIQQLNAAQYSLDFLGVSTSKCCYAKVLVSLMSLHHVTNVVYLPFYFCFFSASLT